VLPVPRWIYGHLERWHHLSFLRTPRTLALLFDLQREALEPERFQALVHVVQEDLGFPLHRSVEAAKVALTRGADATLRFEHGPVKIAAPVTRAELEAWIAPELGVDRRLCRRPARAVRDRPPRRRPRVPDRRLVASCRGARALSPRALARSASARATSWSRSPEAAALRASSRPSESGRCRRHRRHRLEPHPAPSRSDRGSGRSGDLPGGYPCRISAWMRSRVTGSCTGTAWKWLDYRPGRR
jgi:hypothetical protein